MHEPERLELAVGKNRLKAYLNAVKKAINKLKSSGSYQPDDLAKIKEYKDLIDETHKIVNAKVTDSKLSKKMKHAFTKNTFLFAGLKTHAQLFEASSLLDNGNIKNQSKWVSQVSKLINRHKHWLEAEYDFAVSSVQMAERWERFNKNTDRYLLQYRTASDDRVRVSHRPLHNITLPKTDPFWDKYFPPNGWRCRCTTVEVLARNNEKSDSQKAQKLGEKATTHINKNGKNTLKIFRFNAGKEKIVFPEKHPYHKVKEAGKAKAVILTMINNDRYIGIEFKPVKGIKNGGVLEIFTTGRQYKQEWRSNKKAAKILANSGGKYRLLPVINDFKTNPDGYNLILEVYSDIKTFSKESSSIKNSFQNAMKSAVRNGAEEFVFHIDKKVSSNELKDLYKILKYTIVSKRNKKIKHLVFIMPDNRVLRYKRSYLEKKWIK